MTVLIVAWRYMEGYLLTFWAEAVILFIAGLFMGSFLNVVALSYDNAEKIIKGRSACVKCQKQLSWYELIPLLSYFVQWGKCRGCKKKISSSYVYVELGVGLLFGLLYIFMQPLVVWWALLMLLIVLSVWVVIFLHDAYTMMVPMEVVVVGAVLALVYHLFINASLAINAVLAGVIAALFIALIRWIGTVWAKKEAMGTADIYVAAMIGLLVGMPNIYVALFLSFIFGSIYGVVMASLKSKSIKGVEIPFAPALLLGGVFALLFGSTIISWYLGYL